MIVRTSLSLLSLFSIAGLASLLFSMPAFGQERAVAGRVVTVMGRAVLKKHHISVGDNIYPGDRIDTGRNGSVKLLMADRTILDISPMSSFTIEQFQPNHGADRDVDLKIDFGRVRSSVNQKLEGMGHFQLRTKSSVLAVRGTEFIVTADRASAGLKSQVVVAAGKVEVTPLATGATPALVTPGNQLISLAHMDGAGAAENYQFHVAALDPTQLSAALSTSRVEDKTFLNAIEVRPADTKQQATATSVGKSTMDVLGPASVAPISNSGSKEGRPPPVAPPPILIPGFAAAAGLVPVINPGVSAVPGETLGFAPPPSVLPPPAGVTIRVH